ncbi:NAD(P)-binding domain [Ceraceosorus bombacis]|uniref:NAD(P)-binding domain n=1 Tax=Ceraceosorus bombacis TaxID=401625 RepID=A0A0P1BI46_9BASI|nr:NAD(P)-binding domain [Ceraceosorus bombacis]
MSCLPFSLTDLLLGPSSSSSDSNEAVDLLLLGSGWTGSFLVPQALEASLRVAYTTRAGASGSIAFHFDAASDDVEPFRVLPDANTVLIVFPFYEEIAVKRLVSGYLDSREASEKMTTRFIALGSTGIWDYGPTAQAQAQFAPLSASAHPLLARCLDKPKLSSSPWQDRHSPHVGVPRGRAEDYLLSLSHGPNDIRPHPIPTSVLNLSGLWGHGRSPRRFIARLAPAKESIRSLTSVHFVHGRDVARAVLAMHGQWAKANGQRWLLTNERVYDMWDLISQWGNAGEEGRDHPPRGPQAQWIQELIRESRGAPPLDEQGNKKPRHPNVDGVIRSLPRSVEQLGHALDGTDFWSTFDLAPDVPWVD